jgi:hypothetical protein
MLSLIIIIPWIIFGFKNSELNLFGLNQTKKSLILLLVVELTFFLILYYSLPEPTSKIAGLQSFSWNYFYAYYAKGIIPTWFISESIDGKLGDRIDLEYKYIFLIVSLIFDYLILLIISPNLKKIWKRKKAGA